MKLSGHNVCTQTQAYKASEMKEIAFNLYIRNLKERAERRVMGTT
jgi:hypothetical protein